VSTDGCAQEERWNRHDVADLDFVNVIGLHRRRFRNTQVQMERPGVRFLTPELALAHLEWSTWSGG
jgi:hypothetical protein